MRAIMKIAYKIGVALLATSLCATARATDDEVDAEDVGESVGVLFSDVMEILSKEKIHSQFDMMRQLKDVGVSYQAALLVPDDLGPRLDLANRKRYAGIKLFDAIYAATFMKRKEAANAVMTIEQIQSSLDLRSYADISDSFFKTVKKAAAEPESVQVQELLDQLANDYVHEIPAMLSSEETASYLIEGLYGFTVEISHILLFFSREGQSDLLREGVRKSMDTDWYYAILDIFDSFNRSRKTQVVDADLEQRLGVLRQIVSALEAERSGSASSAELAAYWSKISLQISSIRADILTPAAEKR